MDALITFFGLPFFLLLNYLGFKISLRSSGAAAFFRQVYEVPLSRVPRVGHWLLSLFAVTLLRDFLDLSFEYQSFLFTASSQIVFTLFWLSAFGSIYLFALRFFRVAPAQTLQLLAPCSVVILSVPIFDALFELAFRIPDIKMGFNAFDPIKQYFSFMTWQFFAESEVGIAMGATPGMLLEIAIISASAGWAAAHRFQSSLRGTLASLAIYSIIFVLGTPAIFLGTGSSSLLHDRIINLFFVINLCVYGLLAVIAGREIMRIDLVLRVSAEAAFSTLKSLRRADLYAFLRNSRPERLLHYELLFALGVAAAPVWCQTPGPIPFDALAYPALGIAFAWFFAIGINDEYDLEVDRVSSPKRPLVTGALTIEKNRAFAWFSFFGAVLLMPYMGRAAHPLLVYLFITILYSAPPFRMRRSFLLAQVLIGLASLCLFYAGLSMRPGFFLEQLPKWQSVCFIVIFALATLVKDIKDLEGDKKAGLFTVFTWLGPRAGRLFISFSLLAALALAHFFLLGERVPMAASAIAGLGLALASYFASEKWVFVIWYGYIAVVLYSLA